jgi:hypothetical protein
VKIPVVGFRTTVRAGSGDAEVILDAPNHCLEIHGLRLEDLADPEVSRLFDGLDRSDPPYSKITVFAWPESELSWVARGFIKEGLVLGFFPTGEDSHIWALYSDEERSFALSDAAHDRIVMIAGETDQAPPASPKGVSHRIAKREDAEKIKDFLAANREGGHPGNDAASIGDAIDRALVRYHVLTDKSGRLLAVAFGTVGHRRKIAELSVCASCTDQSGYESISYLLHELENDLTGNLGILNFHILVPAADVGLNRVLVRLGYIYTGRLVNHKLLASGWESMNIWCLPRGGGNFGE